VLLGEHQFPPVCHWQLVVHDHVLLLEVDLEFEHEYAEVSERFEEFGRQPCRESRYFGVALLLGVELDFFVEIQIEQVRFVLQTANASHSPTISQLALSHVFKLAIAHLKREAVAQLFAVLLHRFPLDFVFGDLVVVDLLMSVNTHRVVGPEVLVTLPGLFVLQQQFVQLHAAFERVEFPL